METTSHGGLGAAAKKALGHPAFLGILLTLILSLAGFFNLTFLEFLDYKAFDALSAPRPAADISSVPVIIDIDEKSLKLHGQWPWPRYEIALLLNRLNAMGVRALGIDIMFPEKDRTVIDPAGDDMPEDLKVDLGIENVRGFARHSDRLFADAVSKSSAVLGFQFLFESSLELILAFITGTAFAVIFNRTSALLTFLFACGGAIGLWTSSVLALKTANMLLSPVLPILVLLTNFSSLSLLKFWREERKAKQSTRHLALAQEAIIESMASLTETRDPETGRHIKRTQNYVRLLARALKNSPEHGGQLDDEAIDLLYKSAALHDIGKVGVPDSILLQPGKLSEKEFEEIKKHAVIGRDAIRATESKLENKSFLQFAHDIAYTHHEKWNGNGYPQGLRGEMIPLCGRIMALADTYDALVSRRVYKSQLTHEEAVKIIIKDKGTHFDPDVVDAFITVSEEFRNVAREHADSDEQRLLKPDDRAPSKSGEAVTARQTPGVVTT